MAWTDIWKNREATISDYTLASLLKLNGYDGVQADLNPDNLKIALSEYESMLRVVRDDSFYDVGCGSGAFLYYWSERGHNVGGCDISHNLIDVAKKSISQGTWEVCEAKNLRIKKRYDHVTAFGSFFYFPDYDYAQEALYRMIMKSNKTVSVFDVPDITKKESSEAARRELIPDYDEKYKDAPHLYYHKDWWMEIAMNLGLRCYIYEQRIPGYKNSEWRYNITYWL